MDRFVFTSYIVLITWCSWSSIFASYDYYETCLKPKFARIKFVLATSNNYSRVAISYSVCLGGQVSFSLAEIGLLWVLDLLAHPYTSVATELWRPRALIMMRRDIARGHHQCIASLHEI
jgi:hypothetical protein